jgi:hypothetical protein
MPDIPADRTALLALMSRNILCTSMEPRVRLTVAEKVLAAIEAAGCVVVPVEPTEMMLPLGYEPEQVVGVYRHMLAASPYQRSATARVADRP